MVANGDADKGLWLTEFGFSTCGTASKVCVTTQQQAEFTRDSFRIAAGWSYVRAAMVYTMRNPSDTPNNRLAQFGLVNHDFSKKPAYDAFKSALHEFYGPNAAAQPDASAGIGSGVRLRQRLGIGLERQRQRERRRRQSDDHDRLARRRPHQAQVQRQEAASAAAARSSCARLRGTGRGYSARSRGWRRRASRLSAARPRSRSS